jgi:hypothetical protein
MNPERALREQIEAYRRMTGEQRLAIARELHDLLWNRITPSDRQLVRVPNRE